MYRVQFTGPKAPGYSFDNPKEFLSERAIKRRTKNFARIIEIDSTDLPVNHLFIDSLKRLGVQIRHVSKWLNSATIATPDTLLIDTLHKISFVDYVEQTKPVENKQEKRSFRKHYSFAENIAQQQIYDIAENQLNIHNGKYIHGKGFCGNGVHIAIMDVGFEEVDNLPVFNHLFTNNKILGTYNFVHNKPEVFDYHSHGTKVLSFISAQNQKYHPAAVDASFWLFITEDATSEYIVEEDNWIAAVELADSAGVDIITTSLGYSQFDNPEQNHSNSDMDGKTTRMAIAAKMASDKGILVVTSAGNSGNKAWKYITTPADAHNILAVGATDINGSYAYFSSIGIDVNEQIKPDIAAIGYNIAYYNTDGNMKLGSGTSFAAPVIAGLSACLWQAFPWLDNMELMELIKKSADQYQNPDYYKGYGVPDFGYAYGYQTNQIPIKRTFAYMYPNPARENVTVELSGNNFNRIKLRIINLSGQTVQTNITIPVSKIYARFKLDISQLQTGVYVIEINTGSNVYKKQLIKVK